MAGSSPDGPVLSISDLTIELPEGGDRRHAVKHVSFDVAARSTVCLMGESGSGKSVIAQATMGLLPGGMRVVGGRIALLGENLLQVSAQRLRSLRGQAMGMVFQEPMTALNPVMTCGSQVDEVLAYHRRLPRAERRREILRIFERVRLPDPERMYSAYPHQLSGGQRQRIVIALAVILRPALLICDEPTTALDVTTQAEILSLIAELQAEAGTAVLFITHDFGVAAEIADSVVVLKLGDVVEQGSKTAILSRPRHDYTRMLLAAVPSLHPAPRPPLVPIPPILDVQNLSMTYVSGSWPRRRNVNAVAGVSLSLQAGETLGIVGESGSGKSTVARCIVRLIDPSEGEIVVGGSAFSTATGRALSPLRRQAQIVFQDPYRSLDPRQTVGESIIEGPINFGVSRIEAWSRAKKLMELVHLKVDALKRYPSEFSGGQRQRICIARALACEPKLLIADEAVSALDVSVQAQILKLLDEIQQQLQIGILFITHDLRVAARMCDRVIVMQTGRVVEQGRASEILQAPKHPYTRSLVDAAPGREFEFAMSQ